MAITDQEYEDAYAEALFCLADDGHTVGIPFANGTGVRRCEVDSRSLDDKNVLELWWGEIASQILEGR
jgi:hypothetical protein